MTEINTNNNVNCVQIPCNVCCNETFTILYPDELNGKVPLLDYNFSEDTRKTFQIVKCEQCGLVFTNPMPKLGPFYQDTVDDAYLESTEQRKKTAKKVLRDILYYKSNGKLLDIGCSIGVFLDEASQYFEVEGIEMSKWAANEARKRHNVHSAALETLDIEQKFDVITMFGVIEHFEDPGNEIKAIAKALKPGGILVLYTGDIDAWLPRILGKRWWWYQGMHLYYFSRKTCSILLKNYSLSTVKVKNYTVYFQLFSLAKSLSRYAIGRVITPLLISSVLRSIMIPLTISGEMLLIARKD